MKRTPFRSKTAWKRKKVSFGVGSGEQGKKRSFGSYRGRLRVAGVSDTATLKQEIQSTLRSIVILRDGGCILRNIPFITQCNGYRKDGELVLQADHLITRANSATYADTRLVVCVCKGHHGWKEYHKEEYDELVRNILSPERVKLWREAQENSWRPSRTGASDWKLELIALKLEYEKLSTHTD